MGCDHKIKTKMVCENIMHNRTLRGDKIHNPLSDSSPFWKFWSLSRRKQHFLNVLKKLYSFRKNTCNFITFWGEGVQNLKVTNLDFNYVKPSFDFMTKGFFNPIWVGGLNQPALFSDGYFSMKKGVWRSQISWLFLIHYELSEKQKKIFWFFTVFWGDLEGAGWFSPPPLSSNIQEPHPIRVKIQVPSSKS